MMTEPDVGQCYTQRHDVTLPGGRETGPSYRAGGWALKEGVSNIEKLNI